MNPVDIIVIAVIALIVGGAIAYVVKAKKNGKKCIGCPYGSKCGKGSSNGCCDCSNAKKK